jgi:hypothetical protein
VTNHRSLGLVGALAWLAATAGCSVIAVQGPPKSQKPRVDVACTVDGYAPALDLATAAGGVLSAFSNDPAIDSKGLLLLVSGAYLASGLYGLYTTSKCAKVKNAAYAYHAKLLGAPTEAPAPVAPPASARPRAPADDGDEDDEGDKTAPPAPLAPPPEVIPEQ